MLAIEIVKPFLHGRHNHKTLFLDMAIIAPYVAEGM